METINAELVAGTAKRDRRGRKILSESRPMGSRCLLLIDLTLQVWQNHPSAVLTGVLGAERRQTHSHALSLSLSLSLNTLRSLSGLVRCLARERRELRPSRRALDAVHR